MSTEDRLAKTADMRIEVVKRELNQGALAGFQSSVTDYAARLVVAALDSFDAAALAAEHDRGVRDGKVLQTIFGSSLENLQAEFERGVAEGRRQATEGWERQWGVELPPLFGDEAGVHLCEDEALAHHVALREPESRVVSRLVGPWEPTEQDGSDRG